jgi:small multidrug resistance pump
MAQAFYLLVVILLNVCANLLMRLGASTESQAGTLHALLNWKSVTGVVCFGTAAIFYLLLLRKTPLSLAQGFIAIQFLLTVVASQFFLGEKLDTFQWVAILLIASGITLLGWRSVANEQIGF